MGFMMTNHDVNFVVFILIGLHKWLYNDVIQRKVIPFNVSIRPRLPLHAVVVKPLEMCRLNISISRYGISLVVGPGVGGMGKRCSVEEYVQ